MKVVEIKKKVKLLYMNGGSGETSYAHNSMLQNKVLEVTKMIREQAMIDLCTNMTWPATLCIADLGCSSGPNTWLVVSELIKIAHNTYKNLGIQDPEYHIHLNDLPMNDFNTVFRSSINFQESMREQIGSDFGQYFVSGVPGTFYGRLFPAKSLHFVHSSYCLMWSSQVPEEVGENNKRNMYLAPSSPANVLKAYIGQFQSDFSVFLKSRSEELVGGGRMALTLIGRESDDPKSRESAVYLFELVTETFNEMISERLIDEEKLNTFNLPFYTPSAAEVEFEVSKEGSFIVNRLEVSITKWSVCKDRNTLISVGHNFAQTMRPVLEPLLASHFGHAHMDKFTYKFGEVLDKHMVKEEPGLVNIAISLTRKS